MAINHHSQELNHKQAHLLTDGLARHIIHHTITVLQSHRHKVHDLYSLKTGLHGNIYINYEPYVAKHANRLSRKQFEHPQVPIHHTFVPSQSWELASSAKHLNNKEIKSSKPAMIFVRDQWFQELSLKMSSQHPSLFAVKLDEDLCERFDYAIVWQRVSMSEHESGHEKLFFVFFVLI